MSECILVTGFGPFGDHNVNASWQAVKLLPEVIDNLKIVKKEIPVTYKYVECEVPSLWQDLDPILVIHVGVSSFTDTLAIEECANRDGYTRIDCSGMKHSTGKACFNGDDCIFTEINIKDICATLNESGKIKSHISNNAGRYLCEFIYYNSLKINKKRTLFIHVPPLDQPYSAAELSEGLLEVIKCALKQIEIDQATNRMKS
ncbi:pyroglutamyl-peptidase 1 [Leptinotarsa decemlineata]|uniref:pyroglutamyl-peptidase 1 n=1 Tax=Leptinotarsa decemlineata TaxID=7539 RepID=UPI000C253BEA|nr:pyroglutamyl-peptidase 1 [Leptinotarsa decemlineata]